MKLYLILFVANWALVLSKPIETQEKAELKATNEDLVLAAIRHFVSNNLNSELGKISLVRG